MSKNDKVTKPIVLDLDAIGTGSPKLSVVLDAQNRSEKQAQDALVYFASDDFAKTVKAINDQSARLFADVAQSISLSKALSKLLRNNTLNTRKNGKPILPFINVSSTPSTMPKVATM